MATERESGYLLDMLIAARRARRFNEAATEEGFRADEVLQSATVYQLSVIGEAARHVSPQLRSAHPEIPWRLITGMRHRLVHDYRRVRVDVVWETVQNDLPPLIAALESIIDPQTGGDTA